MTRRVDPSTTTARAGLGRGDAEGVDLVAPISLAAVRAYADLPAVDEAMEGRHSYRRYGGVNPELLEAALVELETVPGRPAPVARVTSSGQAALLIAMTLLVTPTRRRVVLLRPCYGGTESLLAGPLGTLGVQLTTVDVPVGGAGDHGELVTPALGADVAAVVTEVITNPLVGLIDVPAVAAAARRAGAACIVDATFAPPMLFQAFAHGADLVIHSLTKHLSGHSDVLGGALLVSTDHPCSDWLDAHARLLGCNLSPFDAWLALRGLRTAGLRIERSTENAAALATFLSGRSELAAVHYPGRHGAEDAALAQRLLPRGCGAMLSIDLHGGSGAADVFIRALDGVRLAPSLGDVSTTISHPASTSHRALSPQQRQALGIGDGLIRVSTGIEHIDDLTAEFDAALVAASAG
ncbi:MAG TPA: PLP-dependent aspartate aminotransferase family protein [Candidatus Saccharimonadales bacterium]|nr:PLP-dependent aspartate aminotransferase family protein [Candidatus Saccharimonadales bacterium]